MKRTKIVATLGLSSNSKEGIRKLIEAGINVARINFSHGTHESNGGIINYIKELRSEMNIPVGIMADLQGPRIRTLVESEVNMEKGEIISVGDISLGDNEKIEGKYFLLDWPEIISDIPVGGEILIEDGLMKVKVISNEGKYLKAEVINEGVVKNHKGVNIPDVNLKGGSFTQKDEKDLEFAVSQDVDYIALSFVSNAEDILKVKNKIVDFSKDDKKNIQVVAKIERKEAIKNIDEIISATDVIMVARGDLGIEMEESKVVLYQKEIIRKCLHLSKSVIVATQMLNSMIENPRPTRAEVSDVSNAVIDHTDAVMLSGETANGKYPIQSVEIMSDIIKNTEESPFDDLTHGFLNDKRTSISAAVAHSAHELQKDTFAKAIVVASVSGFTARMISRHRPECPIFVMTNSEKTHQQLSLVWGVESFVLSDCKTMDELIDSSLKTLKENKYVNNGDKLIIVAGRPHINKDHMSLVKIEEVD